jgi:hypothetical protein
MLADDAKKMVSVVIPFYKDKITAHEAIALQQCFKVLAGHPIIAIKPNHLALSKQVTSYPFTEVISFDDGFFKGIEGYNKLMLSPVFYKTFLGYEFILIYQLDAFVFEDKLKYWCQQRFDYIGAPWLKDCDHPDMIKAIKSNIKYFIHTRNNVHENGEPSKYQYENKVGNGGLSLRRVEKIYNTCVIREAEIANYLIKGGHHYNEDRYLCVEINRKRKTLKIPGYKKGVKFAFEMAPQRALRLNNNQLPFGCHAWDLNLDFWRPFFKDYNYDI